MSDTSTTAPAIAAHGAKRLPSVDIDSYNLETKDDEGFLGDRANKGAFRDIVDNWRKLLRKKGDDPLGKVSTDEMTKKELDQLLVEGDAQAAAIMHGAIEEFATEFAGVIRRFMKLKAWRDTERIVIGGGLRESRIGEIVIGRTGLILKADDIKVDLVPIRNHPDEAGLIGAIHLAPSWMFKGHNAILAVDIGGTNIRCGVIETNQKKASDLSKAKVWKSDLWRHADEEKLSRDAAVKRLKTMIEKLMAAAEKEKIVLAPFIGIGCPGVIDSDGSIERGAQNLPGNWSDKGFHLPSELQSRLPPIDDQEISILLHNDAVTQGLSEVPFMQDIEKWGVLTIGTGLGNARFTNRTADSG
jgi:hypothetical protein